ncbi:SDR family oxidoreductase [Ornithinibacillus massiliensis]|uniref:SDR family oxidoreductase n=1 Tax=Ornithinibacillus massiliensis TaxID=1944633 RepID=A0ABS5MF95_9BACI|nr:SDR family oxidoreductase [Ornithinibacillus massiliensis]MBS3680418.1 SDR family oxidoreductase [Ornithinibacillus massiliensis]
MKVAFVTGANGGFGKLIIIELLKAGYRVIGAMRNQANQKEIMDMAREINLNQQLEIVEMDVTDEERIKEVSKWISDHFGQLDVLINNAGYSQGGFTSDLTMEEWENQYDTNVMGVIRTTFHLLPLLRKSTQGKIINMSSVSGYFGFPGMGPYCSSKFALEGYSESLRMELLPMRIYVSLVEPASFKTGIWEKGLEVGERIGNDTIKKNAYAFAKQSYQNAGDPIEVAKLVRRICEANRPKFRYQVGKGAKSLWLMKKFIPWTWIEKTVMRKLNR